MDAYALYNENGKEVTTMKKSIPYALYCLCCSVGCYVAAMLKNDLTMLSRSTLRAQPWTLMIFLTYALLGAMWCAEAVWARRMNGTVVRLARIAAILLLLFLGLGWYFGIALNAVAESGTMPLFALLIGYLFVSLFFVPSHRTEGENDRE